MNRRDENPDTAKRLTADPQESGSLLTNRIFLEERQGSVTANSGMGDQQGSIQSSIS